MSPPTTRSVTINQIVDDGHEWVNVTAVRPFGLKSSAWLGRKATSAPRHRGKQGLRRQMQKMLHAAQQHPVDGKALRVVVDFCEGVTREVHDALREMGIVVRGWVIEPPYPWQVKNKRGWMDWIRRK